MAPESTTYFISYAREDADFALRLAQDLREAGAQVWIDQLDIKTGERWARSIERAVTKCSGLIFILSPDSITSDNVMDEVDYALDMDKKVLPVMFRQVDLPFRIRRRHYVDFTEGYDNGLIRLMRDLGLSPQEKSFERLEYKKPSKKTIKGSFNPTGKSFVSIASKKEETDSRSNSKLISPWVRAYQKQIIVFVSIAVFIILLVWMSQFRTVVPFPKEDLAVLNDSIFEDSSLLIKANSNPNKEIEVDSLLPTGGKKMEPETNQSQNSEYPSKARTKDLKAGKKDLTAQKPTSTQIQPRETKESNERDTDLPYMVFVEGGTFNLDCSVELGDECDDGQKLNRKVTLSDFYIGRYEVTFEEYDEFCVATNRQFPNDELWGRDDRPVINVSWLDAVNYCNWRSRQEGLKAVYRINGTDVTPHWNANGYRLPTAAEWEYAARGGRLAKSEPKQWGREPFIGEGWNSKKKTNNVGQLQPNYLGLYDIGGNVWEWCWDLLESGEYPTGSLRNPTGPPGDGMERVLRGGSWSTYFSWGNDRYFKVELLSKRANILLYKNSDDVGFRLARNANSN